jgi:hypothetical protein
MKRPQHDLTWHGIRRRWALPKEPNVIDEPIGIHHYKNPSAPLLSDTLESLSNNIINVGTQSFEFLTDREKQGSDSVLESSVPPILNIKHSDHYQDLSKVLPSCNMEMVRSGLRIIISQLAQLTQQVRRQQEEEDVSQDWKFVAMVIDRLCFIIHTASMLLFTGLTLISAPNFFKLR